MTINFRRARQHLEAFDFKRLFAEELGWGRSNGRPASITVDSSIYRLTPVADLGDMVVYTCETQGTPDVPPVNSRRKIDQHVGKLAFEHIIIFVDSARTVATWLWVKRVPGEPLRPREHTYHKGQPGDSLLQKLAGIAFQIEDLDEEGKISITKVAEAVKKSFDVERVTKRFYDEFKSEHDAFMKLLSGLDDSTERAWYTSVMLNRLMFIYFIQKKNFLDGDPDYLRNRLKAMKKHDRFYRDFLVPLFFEGFAQEEKERSPETRKLLGNVPYLNGGLFQPHQLEQAHGKHLDIPDKVFERLFKFFDEYTWHLDDRPMHADNEINPDVLGYIFEKYINQKQMGAYYTKEDITGYICRNTILPFLFDKLVRERFGKLDHLPMDDVEPYIYPAVKQKAYLPTETEREYAARQKRLAQIRADFKAGKIASINELITYNLDIERFMQDWLRGLKDPATLQTFYFECLSKLTVLDPTVGSGAFLFAAMNILESLYELALDRMEALSGPKYPKFKEELARVDAHPNRRHFVYKSIIVNNLFGVDIMEEATEICKLRLFLKLVAQVEKDDTKPNFGIEPLPDIDFNIRAGNTLVGYATVEEVELAATRSLFNMNLPQKIKEADFALRAFRDLQTRQGISASMLTKAKADTKTQLAEIEKVLNESLSAEYGARSLAKFVESHKPFHWYVEFNQIMQDAGFDVIVGNPPYVDYSKVRDTYRIQDGEYTTLPCTNLYAYVTERIITRLVNRSIGGRFGVILPLSSTNANGNSSLQRVVRKLPWLCISHFAVRPSKLFVGVDMNLTIICGASSLARQQHVTSSFNRWLSEFRPFLFETLAYCGHDVVIKDSGFPKFGTKLEVSIWEKLASKDLPLSSFSNAEPSVTLAFHGFGRYWRKCIREKLSDNYQEFKIPRHLESFAICSLNSQLAYWYWIVSSDCYRFTKTDALNFPVPKYADDVIYQKMAELLLQSYEANSVTVKKVARNGQVTAEKQFFPAKSKQILDEIDRVLAKHYGFTDEELDFIINYDIKYRMGRDSESLIE